MEKITVQHFVNEDLNPRIENNRKKYPLYVQVITLRRHLRFKSNDKFFEYLSKNELKNEHVEMLLRTEKQCLERIVRDLINLDKKDLITSKNLSFYSQDLFDVIDNKFCKLLLKESIETKAFVPDVLTSATYSEIYEVIKFFNDSIPISSVSKSVNICLMSIQALTDCFKNETLYVYDIFYGDKKESIESELYNYTAGGDIDEMIESIQNLIVL